MHKTLEGSYLLTTANMSDNFDNSGSYMEVGLELR